ncbi:MAG TPA: DUF4232 domain-containing protein [Acidimicrobiales bacterium]|nr:DUF4232 domain-containing protein [Acidimicrobiales bacterium]
MPPSVPGRTTVVRAAAVLAASCLGLLSACSGGSPSATSRTTAPTTSPQPTTPGAPACAPSSVAASVDFTKFGGTSSTLAGALVFRDTSSTPCALSGVPRVQVLGSGGQPIPTVQAPGPARVVPAVLTPATAGGTGAGAGASITFSSWHCATDTLSLSVRFPGWSSPVPAAPTAASGTNSTTPCSVSAETGQTIYIGPVEPVS